ncbi:MAG: (2Fe-2S) ferredoxin domain-containing protein [Leptolyngbya sp. SIO1E4]|nr:(2Fe-2S) ferredoxin domain-containing protein [Leptolyngbya sp. SIO1E4]
MSKAPQVLSVPEAQGVRSQGCVLKGEYVGAFRSSKGKLKGLLLRSGSEEYTIKLPKYLRPILVRELTPESFIQVWAYPDDGIWRAVNVLPLPEAEAAALRAQVRESSQPSQPQASKPAPKTAEVCIQVCRKGKCFKQGSKHIWQMLQAEVEANPDLQHVSIEATGCLKACKKGPNLRVLPSGKLLSHVNASNALRVLSNHQ